LLDCLTDLHARGFQFEVVFVGHSSSQSPYVTAFLERIERASSWAKYVGLKSTSDLIKLMDQSSALIHVPQEESFGLVVAEGLARGLKFFGFRIGGVPDIANDVPGAELFDDNDWSGLSSSLAGWLQQGAVCDLEASGLMRERYCPEVIAKRHIEIYREVLGSR
jgi:glycosyltransferase involved in cell wall biosynthesis